MVALFLFFTGFDIDKIVVGILVFMEFFLVTTRILSYFFDKDTKFGKILRKIMKGLDEAKRDIESITSEDDSPKSDK